MGSFGKLVNATLRDALQVVCEDRPESRKLGFWLRKIKGRRFGGYVAKLAGESHGDNRWWVTKEGEEIIERGTKKSIIDAMFW
jgi:hypothetical protein